MASLIPRLTANTLYHFLIFISQPNYYYYYILFLLFLGGNNFWVKNVISGREIYRRDFIRFHFANDIAISLPIQACCWLQAASCRCLCTKTESPRNGMFIHLFIFVALFYAMLPSGSLDDALAKRTEYCCLLFLNPALHQNSHLRFFHHFV